MIGETSEQFQKRMWEKSQRQRRFIALDEAAALASSQAKRSPREKKAAVAAAQRGSGRRVSPDSRPRKAEQSRRAKQARGPSATGRRPRNTMQGPQLCAGYCGRMLRPHNTRPGDYPDTLTMVKEGKCSACLVGGTPRFVPPANCTGCSRPFRTHKNPDGEVRHFAKGLCTICTNRAKRGPKKERTIDLRPCLRCGRMTRTERVKAAEAPGTVKRYKSNMCQTCHRVTSGQRAGNAPLVKA